MKKTLRNTSAGIFIFAAITLSTHSASSQSVGENKQVQQFTEEKNQRLQFTKKSTDIAGLLAEPYTLYGNAPSGADNFFISFNLDDKQVVKYELIDNTGRSLVRDEWQDVINQTFRVDSETASSGLYILRVLIGDKYYINRLYIDR